MPDVKKLPKWAQSKIMRLEMEREAAINTLNKFIEDQEESSIYYEECVSTGEEQGPSFKKKYIQSRKITFENGGVELNVYLRGDTIECSYSQHGFGLGEVSLTPTSYQQFKLWKS